nr:Peptidase C13 domain containing protein [Haemonchus contortus]
MHGNHKYRQLVFYLEACEGGSMFRGILEDDINVYAVTSANYNEFPYGTYCENDSNIPCFGDEFSVNWMEDSDRQDVTLETLGEQFELVKGLTVHSHVRRYGNLQKMKLLGLHSAAVNHEISRIQENRRRIEEVFASLVNQLVSGQNTRRQVLKERSSLKNLDCHDDVVRAFDSICIDINKHDYALKYMYVLNNLCTKFNDSAKIIKAMRTTCSGTRAYF